MQITTVATPAPTLPPLQDRTPEQLKQGMVVKVSGAGSDDLAAARLIQDGAQFMARVAGTTLGLKEVDINDKSIDRDGALGEATFNGTDGWFGLSERSTKGVLEGIARLRKSPYGSWTEAQRQDFLQANEAILHESGHVTLPKYDRATVSSWQRADRNIEEGITEIANMTHVGQFMREEYGFDIPPLTDQISQANSAYTRFTMRLTRLIQLGTDGSQEALAAAASRIGDKIDPGDREHEIASMIATHLDGPDAPKQIVDEMADTIDGFVDEENGTRTKLMTLEGALADLKSGKHVDVDAVVAKARAMTPVHAGFGPETPRVGTGPLA